VHAVGTDDEVMPAIWPVLKTNGEASNKIVARSARGTSTSPGCAHTARMLTRLTTRPRVLSTTMFSTRVSAARSLAITPIRSATSTAGPRTSTGAPLERKPRACSTTVTSKPALASQYAAVEPAIPAPEISTVRIHTL
jgi:hypothetical protein